MLWETSLSDDIEAMPQLVPRSGRSPTQASQGERTVPASPGSPTSLQHLLSLLDASSPPHSMQSNFNGDFTKPPPSYIDSLQQQEFEQDNSVFDKYCEFQYENPFYLTPSPSSDEGSVASGGLRATSPYYTNSPFLDISTIKTENHLLTPDYGSPYPLSPCPSQASGIASPANFNRQVEDEYVDIETLLGQNQILGDYLIPKNEIEDRPRDHILLRSVLEDTTFQEKLNLKPVQLRLNGVKMEEDSSQIASDHIDEVLSLAIEHTKKDVHNTCAMLGISPDPTQWLEKDVSSWVTFTSRQFSLSPVSLEYFTMDGPALTALTEDDFIQRAPEGGSTLYAQLEIWKAARTDDVRPTNWCSSPVQSTNQQSTSSNMAQDDVSDEEDSDTSTPVAPPNGKPASKTGSHIHLWQFLKELLATPQLHGSAIRWLDRGSGVFKIEDSVRVARLWGKRKNRPAMNYDKLSRSIRQYYKKGIMKKTERSQRLVYQFCHPYCL